MQVINLPLLGVESKGAQTLMLAEWKLATMPIGILVVSQASTSSEAPVGIGLIPSSDVGGVQLASIENGLHGRPPY